MNNEDEEFFRKLGFKIIKIDSGNHVNCDSCDEEYMDSDEKGGFLFESKAICPKCADRWEQSAKKYGKSRFITVRAHTNETFRDFVYRIRRE